MRLKAAVLLLLSGWLTLSLGAETQQPVKDEPWEFLLLAQFWPGTSCIYFEKEGCEVPPGVKGWTIHGLWPSRNATQQPEFCNSSMPFNISEIEVLRQQLDKFWPYYNKTGGRSDLWAHEWDKHGTCAYSLPSLQGEIRYFSAALQLYSHLDIFSTLSNVGIVPDPKKVFDVENVFSAVKNAYNRIPQIECYYSNGKHYLDQVWLCYDKTLSLTDCPPAHPTKHSKAKSQTEDVQEPSLSLKFESEKSQDDYILGSYKPHSYFVGCPKNNSVYYVPLPSRQVEVETVLLSSA